MNPAALPLPSEQEPVPQKQLPASLAGRGVSLQHHGEILQGVRRINNEEIPCLVSLPVRKAGSVAHFERNCSGRLTVWPEHKLKAVRAVAICLARFDCPCSGHLKVDCQVPVGLGLGSSTCDVVSSILAAAKALGLSLPAQEIAHIAVEAELAVDPIMFDSVVLFAQRKGEVLESFGSWFPEFYVLSVNVEPRLPSIDTLSLPLPRYSAAESARFEMILPLHSRTRPIRNVAPVVRVEPGVTAQPVAA